VFLSSILLLLFADSPVAAESATVRGSVAVMERSGDVELVVPGQDGLSDFPSELPYYTTGLFSASSSQSGRLLIQTSNQVSLLFEGPGFYGIERFESILNTASEDLSQFKESQSRMILNLRRGLLVVDARELDEESQIVLEAPFGRVFGARALWFIQIEFDQRSSIYDFTIACSDGLVRLTDLNSDSYTIYPGQRLAGAGSFVAPAIEVGSHTDQSRERFENFVELLGVQSAVDLDPVAFRAKMELISEATTSSLGLVPAEVKHSSDKRPIVIEFAPRASELSPFRGELRPPSEFQRDIF